VATIENEFLCTAQRHMDIEFFAYNSMLATAKAGQKKRIAEGKPPGELTYSGSIFKLANKINRSDTQTTKAVEKLIRSGWLVLIQDQRRNSRGGWSTAEYRIVEHEEYARTHPHDCPPEKYIKVKGDRWALAKPGKAAPGLRRANARKLLPHDLPDAWLDMLADALEAKKAERACNRADTGNPTTATDTGNPATAEQPTQETLPRPTQETLPRTDTGFPMMTDTGFPTTRFAFESAIASPANSCLPAKDAPPKGGQAGEAGFLKDELNPAQRWRAFKRANCANLPESLQGAEPENDDRQELLALLSSLEAEGMGAEEFCEAITTVEEKQSPPLDTLQYHRWSRILDTGLSAEVESKIEHEQWLRKNKFGKYKPE